MERGIGHEFIERTKHQHLTQSDQQLNLPPPPLEKPFQKGGAVIALPEPEALGEAVHLKNLVDQRTSVRNYADVPLSLDELSYLLWCMQGVKESGKLPVTLRTVPSAGARHAFDTYLLVNRVEGLEPGVYRHLALEHKLAAFLLDSDMAGRITHAAFRQKMVETCAVTFLWVAVVYRMGWRYGQRGYRYLHLDAGHVCQNLYLAAESIGCGVCAIAAYDDDELNGYLQLDGEQEFVIYLAAAGRKP